LQKGLTIITGETGAGKSIILGAMSLIMGNRADVLIINDKTKKCVVAAIFDVSNYNLKRLFAKNEIDFFDQAIIRREISPEGRSRAFINDTPINLSVLKEISSKLIDIHSQHDNLSLNSASFQTEAIDLFAKNTSLLKTYQSFFETYKKLNKELADFQENAKQEKKELDYFQFQYNQLEKAELKLDEGNELINEQKQLVHTEEIKSNLSKINFLLNNDENSVLDMLKDAIKSAENIIDFLSQAKEILERLETASIDLQDLANETYVLDNDLELDPERLEFVNSRLDAIYDLQHKFNVSTVKELLDLKDEFEQKLEQITSFDKKIEQKQQDILEIKQKLTQLSIDLHNRRISAKKIFEEKRV